MAVAVTVCAVGVCLCACVCGLWWGVVKEFWGEADLPEGAAGSGGLPAKQPGGAGSGGAEP